MSDALVLVACWGGYRRMFYYGYHDDKAFFLRQWHDALSRLRHSADVLFVSHGGEADYLDYLAWFRERHAVLDRPNVGYSHGAWTDGWLANPGYDRYILVEDDFLPVVDDFDGKMTEMFEEAPDDCGFLCQLVDKRGVAGIQNGVMSAECFAALGRLPGSEGVTYTFADNFQGWLGKAVRRAGYQVYDMGSRYKAPFDAPRGVVWHHPDAPEILLVPSLIYEDYT